MGSQLVSGSAIPAGGGEDDPAPLTYSDCFRQHLPYYLSIGMSWDQFWHGDCTMVKYYREADRMRRERVNQEAWLHGLYTYEAIADLSPILRASFGKGVRKPLDYPKQPYALDEQEREERKRKEEALKLEQMKAKMSNFAKRKNSQLKGEVTNNE